MAQASSAQREPSMEEILASIRRIIEDSDTVSKQGEELRAVRKKPDFPESAAEPAVRSVVDVDAFRPELRSSTSEPARAAVEVAPEKKPVTPAEVQAQVTPESQSGTSAPIADNSEPQAILETVDELAEDIDIEGDLEADNFPEKEVAAVDAASELSQPTVVGATHWVSQPQPPRTAIISEHAGRQVAAAFGELSEAFAATRKKSFDELAEEMMRPMLQDWLDNNLPLLVERLVREEIERVARGVR